MALPNWYRRCVGCNAGNDKRKMIRITKFRDQAPEIDLIQKKPGRGAYVCVNPNCVKMAQKKRAIEKALHCHIEVDFYEKLLNQVSEIEQREG